MRTYLPDMTLAAYLHYYSVAPTAYFVQVLRRREQLTFPLSYPDPAGEFYGYDQLYLPPTSIARHNIKGLVSAACWAATILVGWYAGQMVPTKRASVPLYSEFVHDEWVSFLTELYEWGSRQWQYLVPEDLGARRRLRRLCARMLAFENHYLEHYRTYLLDELRKSTDGVRYALAQLAVVRFADDDCCAAVEAVAAVTDEPIREEALSALRSIREARV